MRLLWQDLSAVFSRSHTVQPISCCTTELNLFVRTLQSIIKWSWINSTSWYCNFNKLTQASFNTGTHTYGASVVFHSSTLRKWNWVRCTSYVKIWFLLFYCGQIGLRLSHHLYNYLQNSFFTTVNREGKSHDTLNGITFFQWPYMLLVPFGLVDWTTYTSGRFKGKTPVCFVFWCSHMGTDIWIYRFCKVPRIRQTWIELCWWL